MSDNLASFFKRAKPDTAEAKTGKGILYAEDFSDHAVHAEPVPAAPTISEDDVRNARAEGFAAGMEASRHDQIATNTALHQACVQNICDELARQRTQLTDLAEQRAHEIADVLLAMLSAALPAFCAQHGAEEIRALIHAIMPGLHPAARLKIRVHPNLAHAIADDTSLFDHFDTAPTIEADPNLKPGDVKLLWEHGKAVRETSVIAENVAAALTDFGFTGPSKITIHPEGHIP